MFEQQEMFAGARPRESAPHQPHSPPSRAAGKRIQPIKASLQEQVLEYLKKRGASGATDEEIQRGLRMNPSTQRPRRVELVRRRLAQPSGEYRCTRSGRWATVWVAV